MMNTIESLLVDDEPTDILINNDSEIYVDRGRGLVKEFSSLDFDLKHWILHQLSLVGKSWDARYPFVDAVLESGHRCHVAFPPLSRNGVLISLRRLPSKSSTNLPKKFWVDQNHYSLLKQAVQNRKTLLIAGATGSGKTTLMNDLVSEAPESDRIIALEDTPELRPIHPHFISLNSRPSNSDGCGEVTLRDLLKQSLRMRPDRLLLGECRGSEVLDLLQALNTGHEGTMATIHANSASEALRRLELLCILASGVHLEIRSIRELIASALNYLVHVRRDESGNRIISEINRIEGKEGDTILMRPMVKK